MQSLPEIQSVEAKEIKLDLPSSLRVIILAGLKKNRDDIGTA